MGQNFNLLMICSTVGLLQITAFKSQEDPYKCGFPDPKDYYPNREICCDGKIYNKTSTFGRELACCKGTREIYDPKDMVCCGQQLRNKTLLEQQECCGRRFRTRGTGICCIDRWYRNKVGHQWQCCGRNYYNRNEDICCEGVKRALVANGHCCGNKAFNTNTSFCDLGQIKPLVQSCGEHNYNIRDATCCGGKIHNFSGSFLDCCGSSPFNPENEKCEGNRKVPRSHVLCGSGYINPKTNFCCNQQNYSYSSGKFCCNNTVVDENISDCCAGKPFDKRNFQCCGGNIIKAADECCGNQKLNNATHICCRKRAIRITDPYKTECCRWTLYDKFTQKCLSGKVYNGTSARCGGKLVNSTSDLCCNSVLYRGAKISGFKCCNPGYKIYNQAMNQSCCNGVIKNSKRCYKSRRQVSHQQFPCHSLCTRHRHDLSKVSCKHYGMIVQAKKQKSKRQQFRGKKVLFAIQKVLKKHKKNIVINLDGKCSCIRKGSKFVLLTDEFPLGSSQQYTVFKFSRHLRKQLRSYQRKCRKSIPYIDIKKRKAKQTSKKLD